MNSTNTASVSSIVSTLVVPFGHVLDRVSSIETNGFRLAIHRHTDGSFSAGQDMQPFMEPVTLTPEQIALFEVLTSPAYQTGKAFISAGGTFPYSSDTGLFV